MLRDLPTLKPGALTNPETILISMDNNCGSYPITTWRVNLWYVHEPSTQQERRMRRRKLEEEIILKKDQISV